MLNTRLTKLSDFFYVWLKIVLAKQYRQFAPEVTPKSEEIIENPTRGKTTGDFEQGLMEVWSQCGKAIPDHGLLVFTFHHKEGSACLVI